VSGNRRIELGRLDTRRDLTYVEDTVDGFVRAATAPGIDGQTIQLGTGRAVSIGELFQAACSALNVSAEVVHDPRRVRPDASEVLVLQSDPTQARERLGWAPRVSLEQGLARTIDWMKANVHRYSPQFLHV
jgi:UDP-glucose 4-epimerase